MRASKPTDVKHLYARDVVPPVLLLIIDNMYLLPEKPNAYFGERRVAPVVQRLEQARSGNKPLVSKLSTINVSASL